MCTFNINSKRIAVMLVFLAFAKWGVAQNDKPYYISVHAAGGMTQLGMDNINEGVLKPMEDQWGLESTDASYGYEGRLGFCIHEKWIELQANFNYVRRDIKGKARYEVLNNGIVENQYSDLKFTVGTWSVSHAVGLRIHALKFKEGDLKEQEPAWAITPRIVLEMGGGAMWRKHDHIYYASGETIPMNQGKSFAMLGGRAELGLGYWLNDHWGLLGIGGYKVIGGSKANFFDLTGMGPDGGYKYQFDFFGWYGQAGIQYRF